MRFLLIVCACTLLSVSAQGATLYDTLRTTADGSISQWTASAGNKYETVDEDSPNGDTDYIYTANASDTNDFTCGNLVNVSTPDSAWIKVNWTWTRSAGAPQDLLTYYNIGAGWVSFDLGQTTKSGAYITDSVKLTSPSAAQMDALQFRSISNGSSGTEQWRVTWWQAVVWEEEAGDATGRRRALLRSK